MSDPRIERGMRDQLALRRRILDGGADPLGWKVGFNLEPIRRRLEIDRPVAGFLTIAGLAASGGRWPLDAGEELLAEPEVAVEIGADGRSIAALLPALEVVDPIDLTLPLDEIVAGNIFHRRRRLRPPRRSRCARSGAATRQRRGACRGRRGAGRRSPRADGRGGCGAA